MIDEWYCDECMSVIVIASGTKPRCPQCGKDGKILPADHNPTELLPGESLYDFLKQ